MENIEIKNSIIKNLFYLLFSLFVLFLSLFLFYFPDQPILNYLGGFGLFLFGFIAFGSLVLIFDRQPRLIINHEGIYDRTLKVGLIRWYDIKNVYLQKIGESQFICLVLDEEKYHQESRKLSAVKDFFALEDININIDDLDIEEKELIKILQKEIARHENPPKPVSIFDYYDNQISDLDRIPQIK
ncbi:MAG TPA: STM3941 family protein [Pyrinomonadaceae bacterium]|nr:STM3941 family protein [Pyrinomonadaceae bacterium]